MTSIANTLGAGSGVDTAALVTSLVSASFDTRFTQLKKKEDGNSARISTLATLSSGIDSFATALTSLVDGGTLRSQPLSSDNSVLTGTAKPGSRIGSLSAQIEVRQLAQAQSLVSPTLASSSAAAGQGSMTLTTASGSFQITIDATNDSLAGLASAINAAAGGVTASVVTDANGARLMLKGASGAANSFTLTANSGAAASLSRFTWDGTTGGMTRAQLAQDAIVRMDGVDTTHATNTVDTLIEGVSLKLVSAKPGTSIALGVTRPTSAIAQAVGDFVAAYNALKAQLDDATNASDAAFNGNSNIRAMRRQLSQLTSTVLNTSGGPQTLADIGIATNRDGTLTLNAAQLAARQTSDPDGVEALFNPTQYSSSPFIKVASTLGGAKPGSYALANIVAANGGSSASGTIAGVAGVGAGSKLYASVTSPASGLVLDVQGDVASTIVTVDAGLGGALKAIRDSLRASGGLLDTVNAGLKSEKTRLADQRLKLETQQDSYKTQLTKSFTAMDARVAAYKATQSYLTQQVDLWSNKN